MITQTIAILIAAYRELNARKLFWVTMGINLLVVALFASLGINERGVSFFIWTFDAEFFNTTIVSPELFYKWQFVIWGIPWWLTWIATILGLVTTAGMIPDLVTAGAIDTLLSKPIGRVRLFLTKYISGLLFLALQVLVFTTGCFLVIWIRGGTVEPRLFLAVPIVVLFFSYLFAFCAFVGMVTRSTMAALLLTVLFWFMVFLMNTADDVVLAQREGAIVKLEDRTLNLERQSEYADRQIESLIEQGTPILDTDGTEITDLDARRDAANPAMRASRTRLTEAEESVETWKKWSGYSVAVKTVLPKTQETVGLLRRYMLSEEDDRRLSADDSGREARDEDPAFTDPRVQERLTIAKRGRTEVWIIGTSLAFELVLLGLTALIFRRRDF